MVGYLTVTSTTSDNSPTGGSADSDPSDRSSDEPAGRSAASRPSLITRPFVVVTLAAGAFFTYIGVLLPLIPQYIENELGGTEFAIGLNIAVFAIASIAARGALGSLIDRYGRRAIMISGALLAATAGVIAGQMTTLAPLLLMRAFTGVGEAMVFVAAATLIADLAPPGRRAEAASYFSVAVFGGIGVGPMISEQLLGDGRYQLVFAVAGGFAVLSAMLALGVPGRAQPTSEPVEALPDGGGDRGRRQIIHRAAIGPGIVLGSGIAAFAAFGAFIPDYSREVGLSDSGGLFALYSIVCVTVRIAGARLPERLGPRRAVTIALTTIGLGLLVLAAFATVWGLWLAAAILGFGVAFLYPSLMALTVDRVSERERAHVLSSFTMFFEMGQATGGLALGLLAEAVGKRYSFLGGVVAVVVGLWVLRMHVVPAATRVVRARPVCDPAPQVVPSAGD